MKEIAEIRNLVKRNGADILVVSISTLGLVLFRYHSLGSLILRYFLFFVLLPTAALAATRRNPLAMGLGAGEPARWPFHLITGCAAALIIVAAGAQIGSVTDFYGARAHESLLAHIAERSFVIFAVEFLFRGVLLFGLKKRFGEGAILIQMVPFTLMHVGKPEAEAIGCILTGLYFGYVAYRTGSMWPPFIIHLVANVANRILIGP